jgi:uncharacterized membrane protein
MTKQITVNLAALALGAALVSSPAFAQKAANDGGLITEPGGSAAPQTSQQAPAASPAGRHLYNSAPNSVPQQRPPSGRHANDGGPI